MKPKKWWIDDQTGSHWIAWGYNGKEGLIPAIEARVFDEVVALAEKMSSSLQFVKDMPMLKVTPTSGEDRTRAKMATDMINQNISDAKEALAEFDKWKAHYSGGS